MFLFTAFLARGTLPSVTVAHSNASSLLASAETPVVVEKIQCDVCTIDPARPVLIQSGEPLKQHNQTRSHRKRLKKQTLETASSRNITAGNTVSADQAAATTAPSIDEYEGQEEQPP